MAEKFDRFRKPVERQCQCGRGCGLTFVLRPGTGRTRRYAEQCPHVPAIKREQSLAYFYKRKAAGGALRAPRKVRPKSIDSHQSVKWCKSCGGLPHRRPLEGCPPAPRGCGLPYADDSFKTTSGLTIIKVAR